MPIDGEKKFVMRHTFTDVKNNKNSARHDGEEETHFNVPWKIFIFSKDFSITTIIYFECEKMEGIEDWSIDTTIETKILTNGREKVVKEDRLFKHQKNHFHKLEILHPLDHYLVDGNLTVECHVTIHKMTGIEEPFVNKFDNESAKELSDVVLKVKEQKFYVLKKYLAVHSTYFKSLFLGNFDESKQSEVELKDIEPQDFQKFLEVLYLNPDINDKSVSGILKLADMYDSKVVVQQCEKYLIKDSDLNLKEKFLLAIQYKLENLKKKCMPEFKTSEDIASVIPEDPSQLENSVWKELLNLALIFNNQR